MPLYEYHCPECRLKTERLVKMGESHLPSCLKCGGPMEKVFSVPALQFVGSGFYKNDYRKPDSGGSKD